MVNASLSAELEVFQQHRDEWLSANIGKFVAIQDSVVEGFYDTYEEALRAGLNRFGVRRSFLIKQVWKSDPVYCIS
jgi:hypothetical protein